MSLGMQLPSRRKGSENISNKITKEISVASGDIDKKFGVSRMNY